MTGRHPELAAGRWHTFSLAEQLGNVGSEVSRAGRASELGREGRRASALDRALKLMDLTIADPKHRGRLRELCRAREVLCNYFFGDNVHGSTGESLDRYFLTFRRCGPPPRLTLLEETSSCQAR